MVTNRSVEVDAGEPFVYAPLELRLFGPPLPTPLAASTRPSPRGVDATSLPPPQLWWLAASLSSAVYFYPDVLLHERTDLSRFVRAMHVTTAMAMVALAATALAPARVDVALSCAEEEFPIGIPSANKSISNALAGERVPHSQ